ncbi:hypothetical protein AAW51_2942 [Caldimonas brevitalea]|uniref:Uncharacterized protein n=2 Tax=Caldimonas brevitalea TaxID=413882 RepID=A0A0G3BNR7_9BURK|nr:hypothetical protein AAW51_2942 [Caldimonas brevitalea]
MLWLGASCSVLAQTETGASAPKTGGGEAAATPAARAGERCEAAVAETIKAMRGRSADEVQFSGAKRALSPMTDDETGVKGEGQYAGNGSSPMPFTYSCAFNAKTGATSGVVFRDTGKRRSAPEQVGDADLTHISPEACETATASALKQKYPRVGRIAFGSDSRRVRSSAATRASLEGQGGVERAPGMSSVPFTYRCEFETRSGKLLSVQTRE